MIALIGAILAASLLGSFHCAGMCGAFLAVASGDVREGWKRHALLQSAYHGGRLVSYAALGAAAGAAGGLANLTGTLAGLRPLAAMIAGGAMILFGVITFLRTRGFHVSRMRLPQRWLAWMQWGHRIAMDRPPVIRASLIGLMTTLLPCGWLYAFVVTAAGTGSATRGAIAMAAFWAGTLPALVAVGAGVRRVLGPIGARLPVLTAILIVGAGLYALTGRASADPMEFASHLSAPRSTAVPDHHSAPCCSTHDAHR